MKILIIRNIPTYMEVNNNTYNIQEVGLARAITKKGHQCDILFWTDRDEKTVELDVEGNQKIKVMYKHGFSLLKNTIYTGCKNLFDEYDILQPCEYNQMQSWILAGNSSHKTIVYHGPYYSKFNKRYNQMCTVFDILCLPRYIKKNSRFLVKSELAKDFLTKKGIAEKNVSVMGVGIDVEMLSYKGECNEPIYKEICEDTSEVKLIYVGRFEERRNIRFLLEVYSKVLKQNKDTSLYLIGTGDKEFIKSCFDYAEQIGILDKIHYQEKIEQKYLSKVYEKADIFLLPTEYEIFGMVLLEAMYYGLTVFTTYNGGSSTLIQNEINGFVVDEFDLDKWTRAISKAIENKMTDNIGKRAHETVMEGYLWDRLADNFLNSYKNLLSRKEDI